MSSTKRKGGTSNATAGGFTTGPTGAHFFPIDDGSFETLPPLNTQTFENDNAASEAPGTHTSSVPECALLDRARDGDLEALVEVTKMTAQYRRHPDALYYLLGDATGSDRAQASRSCREISIVLAHEKEIEDLWLVHWERLGKATQNDGLERPRDRRRSWLIDTGHRLARMGMIISVLAAGGYKLSMSFIAPLPAPPPAITQVIKPPVTVETPPALYWK